MDQKKLLVVSVLPENDQAAESALRNIQCVFPGADVIHAYEQNFRPCTGCNACWLITPGVCAIKDGYEKLLQSYLEYDAVLFLCGTVLNFVDHRMKDLIDRLLPLVTMYVRISDGQCRHLPRYDKKFRFGLLYSGTADGAYLNRWMERVMLNFGGESLGAYPADKAGEVILCI